MSHGIKRTLTVIVVLLLIVAGGFLAMRKGSKPVASGGYQLYTTAIGNTSRIMDANSKIYLQTEGAMTSVQVQENLRVTPATDVTVKPVAQTSNIFEITANAPLKENTVYTIALAAANGSAAPVSFAIQTKSNLALISSVPRHLATRVPIDTGIELQFNRPQLGSVDGLWSLDPAIPAAVEVDNNRVVVTPQQKLQYRTVYTFRLKSGFAALPKQDGKDTLSDDIVVSFETEADPATTPGAQESKDPSYWYIYSDSTLPDFDRQSPTFYVSVNEHALKRKWNFELYRFDPSEFEQEWKKSMIFENQWSIYGLYNPRYAPPERNRVSTFAATFTAEEESQTSARLVLPTSLQGGQYLLMAPQATGGGQFLWFQVTPLHTALSVSESQSVLWVRKIDESTGVANATVASSSVPLAQTDDRGVAQFATPEQWKYSSPPEREASSSAHGIGALVQVSAGTDVAFIPVDDVRVAPQERMYSFLSTDRKMYLPTDEVWVWGVVSAPGKTMADQEVTIELIDQQFWGFEGLYNQYFGPGGESQSIPVYATTTGRISRQNTFSGKLAINTLKPGYYSVRMRQGDQVLLDKGIEVATFTKPSYQITVMPKRDALFVGDEIALDIQARFFSGEPVGLMDLQYSGNIPQSVTGRVRLDASGNAVLRLKPQYVLTTSYPYYAYLSVSPVEQEEAEITASASFGVYGPTIMMDIDSEQKEKTTTFHVKTSTIDLSKPAETNYVGSPLANATINVTVDYHWTEAVVKERRFDPITKTTYPVHEYVERVEEVAVAHPPLLTNSNGAVDYSVTVKKTNGWYKVSFSTVDPNGRLVLEHRYVSGWYFSSFLRSSDTDQQPGYLRVNPVLANSKDQWTPALYKVGQPITAQVVNERNEPVAIAGQQVLLYRASGSGIESVTVQTEANYKDTFLARDIPTLVVGGIFWGPRGFQRIEQATFSLDTEDRKLTIDLQFDKASYRPGDRAVARARVTTPDGQGKLSNTELTLVDEALYSLYGYDDTVLTETYRGFVYDIQTRTSHPFELRYGFSGNQLGAERGGGDGSRGLPVGDVRKNFKNTAFVATQDTDNDGRTEFTIPLPDNLTGWRVRLQAASSDLYFGSAIKSITTNLPFFVRSILNEVYLVGDAPVMVVRSATATGQPPSTVQYSIKSPTLNLDKTVSGTAQVNIPLGALPEGEHRVSIEGIAGGLRDAIERVISVRRSHKVALRVDRQSVKDGKLSIKGNPSGTTTLTIIDQTDAALVSHLQQSCYADGVRLEWEVGPRVAKELLPNFQQSCSAPAADTADITPYRQPDGGVAVVPYGSSDLDATIGLVNALPQSTLYDSGSVKRYLLSQIAAGETGDVHIAAKVFYGLSAVRAAILPQLEQLSSRSDLSVGDWIYLAASFQNLGATDQSRAIFEDHIAPSITREAASAVIPGDNQVQTLRQSALAVSVAIAVGSPDAQALSEYAYSKARAGDSDLIDFELWAAARVRAQGISAPPSTETTFDLVAGSRTIAVRLDGQVRDQSVEVTAEELSQLSIKNLKGSASVVSFARLPAVTYDGARNPKLSVERRYRNRSSGGAVTRVGDTVDVVLTYRIDPSSEENDYVITDYLPSGLKPTSAITYFGDGGRQDEDVRIVGIQEIEGQIVRLHVGKGPRGSNTQTVVYRARAVQQGTFRADGPNIRGILHPDQYNFGPDNPFVIQ
ncbi:Ig-like domain-containing protein [Candidatus Uhrbacteria bacterium]|nr:Ig-like domain-containing protein [Candidatus Uhrbacteria bacterium]